MGKPRIYICHVFRTQHWLSSNSHFFEFSTDGSPSKYKKGDWVEVDGSPYEPDKSTPVKVYSVKVYKEFDTWAAPEGNNSVEYGSNYAAKYKQRMIYPDKYEPCVYKITIGVNPDYAYQPAPSESPQYFLIPSENGDRLEGDDWAPGAGTWVKGTLKDPDQWWIARIHSVKRYRKFKYWYPPSAKYAEEFPERVGSIWWEKNKLEARTGYWNAFPHTKEWGPEQIERCPDI